MLGTIRPGLQIGYVMPGCTLTCVQLQKRLEIDCLHGCGSGPLEEVEWLYVTVPKLALVQLCYHLQTWQGRCLYAWCAS